MLSKFCHYALQFLYVHCVISISSDKHIFVYITISYLIFLRAIHISFWWLCYLLLTLNFSCHPFFAPTTHFRFKFYVCWINVKIFFTYVGFLFFYGLNLLCIAIYFRTFRSTSLYLFIYFLNIIESSLRLFSYFCCIMGSI